MVDIQITPLEAATLVTLAGELDANSSPLVQSQVLPLAQSGTGIVLDMTNVGYMSSAGLRMLLSTYRQLSASGGRIVLVGLSEDMRDTMAMTGFLDFFTTKDTLDEGLEAVRA